VTSGNGLSGLTERVTAVGGSLSTGAVNGWFTVRATIPAGASA
jgi:signal transduction histidine kinase